VKQSGVHARLQATLVPSARSLREALRVAFASRVDVALFATRKSTRAICDSTRSGDAAIVQTLTWDVADFSAYVLQLQARTPIRMA